METIVFDDTEEILDTNDLEVKLTWTEHEFIKDLLVEASSIFDFSTGGFIGDLPMDSDIVKRYSTLENLKERFNLAWSDRFN